MALIHGGIENLEESVERQNEDLENLENEMDCLFDQLGINDDDCDYDQIEGEELLSLEEEKILLNEIKLIENIRHISYDSPYEYQKIIDSYLVENGFNIENDPILELYSNKEIVEELKYYDEKFGKIKWDKRDYIVIGLTSIIAVAIDFFLVAIPKDMNFKGKDYKGSPLTKYAKEKTVNIYETKDKGMGKWISQLKKYAKVPYDISVNQKDKGIDIPGIRPALHRLMELGHDPILGFVVGVAQILLEVDVLLLIKMV